MYFDHTPHRDPKRILALLSWQPLPYRQDRFFVRGTELAVAIVPGTLSRFAVYETRGAPDAGQPGDVFYAVRDAATVSDDDVRNGRRPAIVARFPEPDAAVAWALAALAPTARPMPDPDT